MPNLYLTQGCSSATYTKQLLAVFAQQTEQMANRCSLACSDFADKSQRVLLVCKIVSTILIGLQISLAPRPQAAFRWQLLHHLLDLALKNHEFSIHSYSSR